MAATSGFVWVWLLMFGGGGLPLPVSVPPLPEDPVMASVAPEECLWYLSWSGCAKADHASNNQTEKLLAEEEVQHFGAELERRLVTAIREHARGPDAIAAQEVPKLVKVALTRPLAVFVSEFKMGQRGPDVKGGLILSLGDQADNVNASIDRLTALAPPGQITTVGKWQRLKGPEGAPLVEWAIDGKYFVVGIGEGSADGIVTREKAAAPKWLTEIRERLPVERPAMVHYLNLKKILALVQEASGPGRGLPPQVVAALGLGNLTSLASVSGLEGSGWTSRMLLGMDGPPTGIFDLAGGKQLTAADLAPIPADATIAFCARLDLDRAYRGISSIAGKIEPRARTEMEQAIANAESHFGIDFSQDILKAVGDTWCVYSAPSEGGLLVTGLTVVAPIRDRARLVKAEAQLRSAAMAEMHPPGEDHTYRRRSDVTIADCTFHGQQIHFLNFIGEPMAVAPAWCITDKELIVALTPQSIKAHLSRGAKTERLPSVPAVSELFTGGQAPTYVSYTDSAAFVRTLYPLLQFGFGALSSEMQREGINIDMSILPSATAILPHLSPSVSSATMTKDGLLIVRQGTLPMDFESLPLLSMPWLMFSYRMSESRTYSDREPLDFVTPGGANKKQSMNNLKQIALAMHQYHSTFGTFPAAYRTTKDGKPGLSWRVQLLPYLEQDNLYKEFNLDEPWDSEHNKKLIEKMPNTFAAPGSKVTKDFKTVYLVPHGDKTGKEFETIFTGAKGTRIDDIRDGTSNTIMVVEASDDRAAIWTKPDDYEVDFKQPMAGLVGLRSGGFLVAFADGSVRFLKDSIDRDVLKALFTRDGGELIDSSKY